MKVDFGIGAQRRLSNFNGFISQLILEICNKKHFFMLEEQKATSRFFLHYSVAEQNCADFDFLNINWSNFKITGQNCVKLGSKQAQTCVFAFTKLKPDFFHVCMGTAGSP